MSPSAISLLVNIVLAGVLFSASGLIMKLLGEGGTKALSKITCLFLAAIAVRMIRKGLIQLLGSA